MARQRCRQLDADLAVVDSARQQRYINMKARSNPGLPATQSLGSFDAYVYSALYAQERMLSYGAIELSLEVVYTSLNNLTNVTVFLPTKVIT